MTRQTPAILLIDDNAIQAATRQTILKRAGYFVIAALSPQRTLEQFRSSEFPEDIGLVITDHIMPGMNGSIFVKELRALHPEMPVLVISGLEEAEAEYTGLNVTFRVKPLLPDNLLATVHGLMPPVSSVEEAAKDPTEEAAEESDSGLEQEPGEQTA